MTKTSWNTGYRRCITIHSNVSQFISLMESKGYVVDHRYSRYDPGHLVVMKNGLYYVAIRYEVVKEAPLDYLEQYVEREYQRLEGVRVDGV